MSDHDQYDATKMLMQNFMLGAMGHHCYRITFYSELIMTLVVPEGGQVTKPTTKYHVNYIRMYVFYI